MALPTEYATAEGLRTLANYLRSQNGIKNRSGIVHEKRVDYFKGKKLIESLLEGKKWPKSIPKITDKGVARLVAEALIQSEFFVRSERVDAQKNHLKISQKNVFEENGYYTWIYAGNMMWSNIMTGLVISLVVGFTLLPIWPAMAKHVLWYCSVTFLIFMLGFCLIRFIAFVIFWIFGYEFWIFPRMFDESLTIQDSFKPIYSFEKGTPGQGYYRIAAILLLIAFSYWACTQPTEFDGFIQAQKDFIDDLYSGNLLSDVAADPLAHMDRSKKVPTIEDLLKDLERDDKEYITETGLEGESVTAATEEEISSSIGNEGSVDSAAQENFEQEQVDKQVDDSPLGANGARASTDEVVDQNSEENMGTESNYNSAADYSATGSTSAAEDDL